MGGGASKTKTGAKADVKPESPAGSALAAPPAPTPVSPDVANSPAAAAAPQTSLSPTKLTPSGGTQDPRSYFCSGNETPAQSAPPPKNSAPSSVACPASASATTAAADTSTLAVSDEEFTRIVGEAFGPMVPTALVSTKWDRKVDALKNIAELLKKRLVQPSELATQTEKRRINCNNSACFRAACLVLERSTCDKILPVLLASHELFRGVFQQAGGIIPDEELRASLDGLLAHVWPKVGDSNIRLHDSAKTIIIFAAGLRFYSIPVVLERLHGLISEKSRGHMRAKQIGGVIDTVCSLVEHFQGETSNSLSEDAKQWTMSQISPFIESGLDDVVGPRTRQGAVKLAGTAFSKLGREAMKPLLEGLRPAVRNLLLQKFDELEQSPDADPELEDVPEVEVLKQPKGVGSARPPTGSKRPTVGGVTLPTGQKPPLAKSKEVKAPSVPKPNESDAANTKLPAKPSRSDAANIKMPVTPRAPNGPSPRQKRLTPNSPPKIFTPSSPTRCSPQPKWKSTLSAQEEDIMDQILEETGLVFGKSEKLTVGLEEEIQDLGLGGTAISCC